MATYPNRPVEEVILALTRTAQNLRRTCINCVWWSAQAEVCCHEKHMNMRPPAPIIVHGCDDYDDFPF